MTADAKFSKPAQADGPESAFMDDLDISRQVRLSRSWVRKQRLLRRNGLPHSLTIDSVNIGRCPRYRAEDVKAWLLSLTPSREADNGQR